MLRSSVLCRLLLAAATLGALELAAPSLLAQTTASETARVTQLFKSGKAAFAKGDMAEAERLFGEAFALRKSSDIAANLGQSELEQQKFRKAAEHFQWALANLLPSATDAQRKAVETGLARSRAEVAVIRLEIKPEGSDVVVAEQGLGKSPINGGVYVDPGEVIVSVKHDGYVAIDKRVMVGKGTEQAVEVTLTPRDTAPAPTASATSATVDSGLEHPAPEKPVDTVESNPKSLVPANVATGVAIAGVGLGIGFMLRAGSKDDAADSKLAALGGSSGCFEVTDPKAISDCAEVKSDRDGASSSRHIALGSFIVGGVAAVVAGYFYWDALSHRESATASRRRPLLGFTPRLDLGRARSEQGFSADTVKLSLSGTF
ncbi:MAG TPA: PEGA domain-containing protein [Polyangiaceae bacterium]|nr:PEGA domain-containing protein [Polyangiaceae bacterium]